MAFKVLIALIVFSCLSLAEDATSQIRAEIREIRASLKVRPINEPQFPNATADLEGTLKAAEDAIAAGRIYLALEKLSQVSDFAEGLRAITEKSAAVKNHLDVFEDDWKKASADLAAAEQQLNSAQWRRKTAGIRAIAELARTRIGPLMEGGRGFAMSTKPEDGLLYVGEAHGQANFARFCASLASSKARRTFPARSILPELLALQEKANAAFQPPRSIDLHPRFIALNSTIKFARELDASRRYDGAMYQFLEAERHYGMLFIPALDAAAKSNLKNTLAAPMRKVQTSKADDSILQILLERAESQIAHADGSAASDDEWKSAQVIVQAVALAYYGAHTAPLISKRTSAKTVDITVVRWPYT